MPKIHPTHADVGGDIELSSTSKKPNSSNSGSSSADPASASTPRRQSSSPRSSRTPSPSPRAAAATSGPPVKKTRGNKQGHSTSNSGGGKQRDTPQKKKPISKQERTQQLVRSMTTVFTEKVNKMHSSHAIDPAKKFWQGWSLFIALLLIYSLLVLPLEVPFQDVMSELFWVDCVVELGFLVDLVLLFFVGYYDKVQGRVILDISAISKAYLKSWFVVDFLSVLPFTAIFVLTGFSIPAVGYLRFLKFLRFARLPRLQSTLQKSDPLNRVEDLLGLSFAVKALFGHLVRLAVLCHWLACIWCLAAEAQLQAEERESWITEYGVQNEAWSTIYLSALYWAVMTFTTIGYGDVVPTNNVERGVSIVSMILAATYYAYLVGAISTIINTSNQATHDFQALMDNLNRWLIEYSCAQPLRQKLRHFFNLSQPLLKDKYYDDVLAKMSPGLRGEFCASLYSKSLARVEFLQPPKTVSADRKTQFLGILAQKLIPRAFPAGEQLIREGDGTSDPNSLMYILRRGLVGAHGRVLRSGGVTGEDIICRNHKRWYRVMCLTFVDALTLSHQDLFETLESSSDLSEQLLKVRRAANRHALRTTILEIVRRVKVLKTFLRSSEASKAGLGSPRVGGYKRISVRMDSDQYFDKSGDIFDPMEKVAELMEAQQRKDSLLKEALQKSVGGVSGKAVGSWGGSAPPTPQGTPDSMIRKRSTAAFNRDESGESATVTLSDAVNRKESIYDVLSQLDHVNVSSMKPVDALVFLHTWRSELLKLYDDFQEDGRLVDREAMSSQSNTPNSTPMKPKPNKLAPSESTATEVTKFDSTGSSSSADAPESSPSDDVVLRGQTLLL